MRRLDPNKIFVEYRGNVTLTNPIINRRYTLTHSDETGELFLTVGLDFAYDKITDMRDEVLAEWCLTDGGIYLHVYVYVGDYGPEVNARRNEIFRRELPLALEAIFYGDRQLFKKYPELVRAPIWIHFDSNDIEYNKFEYWGTPMDYLQYVT